MGLGEEVEFCPCSPMAFLLVCLYSLLLAILSSYVIQLITAARRRLPPGPWPLPVVGNLLSVGKVPHRSFARLAERHGPLMTVRLGAKAVVVASSPSIARAVLQTHGAALSGRFVQDSIRGGGHAHNSIFFLQPGAKWRALRRLGMEKLASARRLEEMQPLRRAVVRDLIRDVAERAASGAPVSVGDAAFAAAVSHAWRAIFSTEMDAATARDVRGRVREVQGLITAPNVSDFFPAVAAADLQGLRRRMARLIARTYKMMDAQIEQRMRRREAAGGYERTNDLLDVMLDMSEHKPEDGNGVAINRDLIRAFCTDMFVGASDTTSSTIEWALAELLQSPSTMRKLQNELKSVIGSRTQVEDSDINQLPYLRAVIKETLRLHPIVTLMQYKANATAEIEGYIIPEGTHIYVNAWAIHHNAEVWTEPKKFIPERFLQKDIDFSDRTFEYLPFGLGRHMCIGMPLANRMLHVILGSLVHQFEWTLTEETKRNGLDMTERFGLVVTMATPLNAIAKVK